MPNSECQMPGVQAVARPDMRGALRAAAWIVLLLGVALPAESGQVVIARPGGGDPSMPFPTFNPPNPKTGTGGIRGRVVAADGGGAVRRAQIRISSQDIGSKTALTDADGRYEFKELPAGRFTMTATKAGYVQMQFGQSRAFEPGRPIELVEAQ